MKFHHVNVTILVPALDIIAMNNSVNIFSAVCLPACTNNGICVAPGQCKCPQNFMGPTCQHEKKVNSKLILSSEYIKFEFSALLVIAPVASKC